MSCFSQAHLKLMALALTLQVLAFAALGQESGTPLRFVGNSKIPPILFTQDEKPVGLVVDLAYAVAEKAHLSIRVEAMDWPEAQSLVAAGKADALLQINPTPEREKLYDFSDILLESRFHIFRKNTRLDIQSLASLYGKKVGVEAGGFPAQYLKEHEQIHLVVLPNWKAGFDMLKTEQIDAVFVDRWVGEYELYLNSIEGVIVVEPPVVTNYSRIAVKKGNTELLARINAGLKEIESDGARQQILKKWQAKEVVYVTRESIDRLVLWAALGCIVVLIAITLKTLAHSRAIKKINRELAERSSALIRENEERKRAEAALMEAHDSLEKRVADRTAELQSANTSLEDSRREALQLMQDAVAARRQTEQANEKLRQEIIDRQQAEETLKQSEDRFRTTFEGSAVAMSLTDPDGKLLRVNAAYCQMLGYSEAELARLNFYEFSHPADLPGNREGVQRLLSGQQSTFRMEKRYIRKDGRVIWGDMSTAVVRDANGRPLHMVTHVQDITERKQAEEAIRERERLFQDVIDGSPSPIFLKDRDGKFITINASLERMLGMSREDIIGKTDYDIAPREVADAWRTNDKQVMATGKAIQIEERADLRDGHHIFLANKFPLVDAEGRTYGVGAIGHDITERKRAEEELQRADDRFRVLTQNLASGVALIDEHGRFVIVNPAFLRLFELSEASDIKNINDRNWSEWQVFEEDGSLMDVDEHPVRKAAMSGRAVRNKPVGVRAPSGKELKWMLISAEPVFKADGRIDALICTYQDITERKRAEEALHKRAEEALRLSEQEFRSLAEAMPQIVWATRPDGWNIYFNRHWTDYTGMTMEESYGHGWNKPFHPDDKQRAWEAWQRATQHNEPYSLECRLRRADGAYRWWLVRGSPMLGENGEILKWFGTCTDIEEIKRAESALQEANELLEKRVAERTAELLESEERFRTMANAMPQLAWMARPDGHIYWYNQRWYDYTGTTPEQMEGWGWQSVHDASELPKVLERWKVSIATGEPFDMTFPLRGADGAFRPFLTRIFPLKDATGRVVQWFGTNTDISEIRRAEEKLSELNLSLEQRVAERTVEVRQQADQLRALATELTQAEQRERKRLAKILHDHIQQLLVAARMQVEWMQRDSRPERLQATAQGVDSILKEALDASRSLTVELSPPILHEAGLIGGLNWLAARTLEKNQVTVVLRAENKAEPPAEDARLLLFECARELLLNAVKHSGVSQAHVTLLRTNDGLIKLIVSDEGKGFDPDVFRNRQPDEASFGLFSIQQRLVHIGGQMEIATAPKKGTCITLTLPAGEAQPVAEETARAARDEGKPATIVVREKSATRRVLIVDDHKIMREGLVGLMQFEQDIEVVGQAADGPSAIELAAKLQPDAVIMDINLGAGMNGVEVTKRILAANPSIKIIGLSMHTDNDVATALRDAGAVAFLTKGGPSEDLIAAIRSACTA